MPENNDEPCSKMVYRVLDASQRIVIHQITGCADDEEVSDVLIKNDFGRRPRISAPHDDREWMLVLRGCRTTSGDGLAGADFTLGEARVAGLQATQSLIGSDRWICGIGRHRPSAQGDCRH